MNRTDKVRKYRIGMRQILCMLAIAVLLDAGIAGSMTGLRRQEQIRTMRCTWKRCILYTGRLCSGMM